MTTFDLIVMAFALGAGLTGFRVGFIARAASWAGMAAGAMVGSRLAPVVVASLGGGSTSLRLLLTLGTVLVGATVGGSAGEAVGRIVRRALPLGPLRAVDRAAGGVAGVLSVLVALWLLIPALRDVPGGISAAVRGSAIANAVQSAAPRQPEFSRRLAQLVPDVAFPQVFDDFGRSPSVGAPPGGTPVPAAAVERVRRSTVNVEVQGCGVRSEGTGVVLGADLVVTNAHVVAGADAIRVRRSDGRLIEAATAAFDPRRDLAVLRAPGLGRSPLELSSAGAGAGVAIVGHPGGQDRARVAPGRIERSMTAVGRDIYGEDRAERQVLVMAADLAQGDSGSGVVDTAGRVVGIVFAIAADRSATAYALDDEEVRAVLGGDLGGVAPGRCQH